MNFAGRHTALSCKNDALCFLRPAVRLSDKSPPSQLKKLYGGNLLNRPKMSFNLKYWIVP